MFQLILGLAIMLAGAVVMAVGLYVRSVGAPTHDSTRTMANLAAMIVLFAVGLFIAVAGIIVSLEQHTTVPR